MRKRNIRIQVRLNDIEYAKLLDDTTRSNENISDYIRKIIMGKEIKEKPDYEFYEVMKQLSKIGVNLNQIAKKANQTDKIDKDYYKSEANNWHKFAEEVKSKFL